jgi:hypothetical protein
MKCHDIREMLALDQAIADADVQAHVDTCGGCARYYRQHQIIDTDTHSYSELLFGLFDLFPLITPYRPGAPSYDQLYRHQHLVGVADAAL